MSLRFERDDAHQRVVLTADSRVTFAEWAECLARQVAEGAWSYATLYDFTDPRAQFPDPAGLARITRTALQLQQEIGQRGPIAFAVGNPEEYDGIRGWTVSVGAVLPYKVKAFRARDDAERWLETT